MKKKYDVLEFYKIVNQLIDYAKLEKTKEKFIDIDMLKNRSELDKELNLLQECIDFYRYDDGFDVSGITNIQKYVSNIELIGSYLSEEDLADLVKNLTIYRISKMRAKNVRDKYKNIWFLFSETEDLKDLETQINEIIESDGTLKDEASFALRDIRKQKSNLNINIKEKFDDILSNKELAKAIQERIITQRNDRYVIPIKTEFKPLIKGIEHDRSATGSTVYIEPLNVVSLNNKLREYESREREEIRKILLRITEIIRMRITEIVAIIQIMDRLDELNAKVLYALQYECVVPKITNKPYIRLIEARHPLIPRQDMVPLDFALGDKEQIMLITGPNTGGKTVTLKVAGLLTIMALSGLPIPANEKTEIGFFEHVFADIGDEQSLEQNLSSFSGHVKSIKEILEQVNSRSLVLMDELGSGTDPMEGAAFAMAITDYLLSKNSIAIITTHYSEVKAYAFNSENIKSASMEFDVQTLSPTYRLLEGIPGESNALIIARKYGISVDIIQKAQTYISDDNQKVEKMIQSIKEKNDELEALTAELAYSKQELEQQKQEYEEKVLQLENEKNEVVKDDYQKADNYLKELQAKAKNLIDKITQDEIKKEDAKNAQRNLNMLRESFKIEQKKNVKVKKVIKKDMDFSIGEEVFVKTINQNGKILRLMPESESLQIQAGILKFVVSIQDVAKIAKTKKKTWGSFATVRSSQVKNEVDLRGLMVDEALITLETYLDRAMLNGYHEVYIIHGKGTMALRKSVQEFLKTSKYISEFKNANQNEGGLGCTIAVLK